MPRQIGEHAASLFNSGSLLCAESVLTALASAQGVESDLVTRIATGFCSGVSRTSGMCGALSGAIMGVGLAAGRDTPEETLDPCYQCVQALVSAFRKAHGAINCRELTGCDLLTPEGQQRFKELKLGDALCRNLVREAARLAAEILRDKSLL